MPANRRLLNRMVGAKVSIVTHKVQTTRARIRGIAMAGQSQIVFVDTPGLFRPRRRLDRAMVAAAWGGAADADIVVLLIEAHRGITDGVKQIVETLKSHQGSQPVALAINKIDRVEAKVLLALTQEMNALYPFVQDVPDLCRKGSRRRGSEATGWRAKCPRVRGCTPKIRSPICRCG